MTSRRDFITAAVSRAALVPEREYVVTGIRTDGAVWVSVDDAVPERTILLAQGR